MAQKRDERGQFLRADAAPAKKRGAAAGRKGWTAAKEKIFFRELAMVCNVSSALRKAGLTSFSGRLYDRRREDPGYGAKWDAAIAESYRYLDLEMLERARFGDDRPEPKTEVEKRLREIPTALALQLLKLHQATARGRTAPSAAPAAPAAPRRSRAAEARRLREEMEARFVQISRRLGGQG
jgi:hypothetical protein